MISAWLLNHPELLHAPWLEVLTWPFRASRAFSSARAARSMSRRASPISSPASCHSAVRRSAKWNVSEPMASRWPLMRLRCPLKSMEPTSQRL